MTELARFGDLNNAAVVVTNQVSSNPAAFFGDPTKPIGGNIVGLETASWKYFGRSVDKLSMAEYATLAVLPNRPSMINTNKNIHILLVPFNDI